MNNQNFKRKNLKIKKNGDIVEKLHKNSVEKMSKYLDANWYSFFGECESFFEIELLFNNVTRQILTQFHGNVILLTCDNVINYEREMRAVMKLAYRHWNNRVNRIIGGKL